MWVAFLLIALAGLGLTVSGWLGLVGKLRPNSWAGIRTPGARSTPERWYAVQRAGSPYLIFGGVAALSGGLAFLPFAIAGQIGESLAVGASLALAVVVVAAALVGWWAGMAAARRQAG